MTKAILIKADSDTKTIRIEEIEYQNNLDYWYSVLDCRYVESFNLDNEFYALFDEEAKLLNKTKPTINIINRLTGGSISIDGNILIVTPDEREEGELRGLTVEEIKKFMNLYSVKFIK